MRYLPFRIAIRLVHVVRYVKGQLIKRPLCIVRYISRQVWKLGYNNRVASIEVTPPAPPFEAPSDFEAKVWEAIAKLKATTKPQSSVQNPPPVEPMPDHCISLLTNQVATLQGEIEYLRQRLSNPDDLYSESEGEEEAEVASTPTHGNYGCCPGLEGQPWVNCALVLD
ncbi:hypothetical protein DSO57_1001495 [Entomophthora muscae]|uniref:Uncharacterized protein n=1 Tax=Entomophthora muscae TaxID=34485 RepID=A0ACC2UUW8_9FUNG|nr:hypothetical protein DSO57_1001495 [Entomophthora muscae]